MQMSTNTRLTKKMAQYLVKRELGLSGTGIRVERASHSTLYAMNMGIQLEICITECTVNDRAVISLQILHRYGQGHIQLYFDPETLEEDFKAECDYYLQVEKEHCESCPYAPPANESVAVL